MIREAGYRNGLATFLASVFAALFLATIFAGLSSPYGAVACQTKTSSQSSYSMSVYRNDGISDTYNLREAVTPPTSTGNSSSQTYHLCSFAQDAPADAGGIIGSVAWQNMSAITQADGNSASANSTTIENGTYVNGGNSHYLVAYGFGFTIPSNASIHGIVAYFYKKGTEWDGVFDNSLKLIQDGMITGTDHAVSLSISENGTTVFWSTSWTLASYGSTSDLWGLSWTSSEINSKFFGIAISVSIMVGDALIDYVRMQVYYSMNSNGSLYNQTSICGSALQVPGSGGLVFGTAAWQNPSAISQADGNCAYIASPGTISDYLMANAFEFTIPSNASINGIVVYFYRKGTAEGCQSDYSVKIVQNWLISGTDHASTASWQTNWTLASYGNSSDLWGLSWTPSEINTDGFGVAISTQNNLSSGNDCYIDYVEVSVYYSGGNTTDVQAGTFPFLDIGVSLTLTLLLVGAEVVKRRSLPARTERPTEESWQDSMVHEEERDSPEVDIKPAQEEVAYKELALGTCMVCNQAVYSVDKTLTCPYCAGIAHKAHILEWLHVKDYCPMCHRHLDESMFSHRVT
jgi:hypothetical protein